MEAEFIDEHGRVDWPSQRVHYGSIVIWHFRHQPTIVGGCLRVASKDAATATPWSFVKFRYERSSR